MAATDDTPRATESPRAETSSGSTAPASPSADASAARPPLTDSPWFWVYLFACGGLILLVVAEPRFRARQTQIERKSQGRLRGAQNVSGQEPNTPLTEEGQTVIRLWPLYGLLACVILVSWGILWNQRYRVRSKPPAVTPPSSKESAG